MKIYEILYSERGKSAIEITQADDEDDAVKTFKAKIRKEKRNARVITVREYY